MFGMKFYSNEDSKEEDTEDSSNIFIVDNNNVDTNFELKQEYFTAWKSSITDKNGQEDDTPDCCCKGDCAINSCSQYNCNDSTCPLNIIHKDDDKSNTCDNISEKCLIEEDEDIENEKINDDDDEEDSIDKLYVISMDTVPYYYENDLVSAREKMWKIANNLLKKDSVDEFDNSNYIFTNDLNKVSLISPYNFFGLNYHHTICELQIDYVIRYNK